jgi:hypothetical protein
LGQVVPSRLAQLARILAQVEHIIDDLEGHSNVGSVLPQRLNRGFSSIPNDRAHLRRSGEERGSLSEYAPFVLLTRLIEAMGKEHFAQLTVAYIGKRGSEYADDPRAIRCRR